MELDPAYNKPPPDAADPRKEEGLIVLGKDIVMAPPLDPSAYCRTEKYHLAQTEDRWEPQRRWHYPPPPTLRYDYDFLYKCGEQWFYVCSGDDIDVLSLYGLPNVCDIYGAAWRIVHTTTGLIVAEREEVVTTRFYD